jgi:hypothetical protein
VIQFAVATTNSATGQNNGSASVENVSAGTAPYTFAWSNGDNTQNAANLAPGSYTVTVTDNNGCHESEKATVGVGNATGISNISDALSFAVYPNPARNEAIVQINKMANGTTFKLENILGQTLMTKPVSELQTQLDLSALPDGLYFIEVRQGEKRAVKQLVLNR